MSSATKSTTPARAHSNSTCAAASHRILFDVETKTISTRTHSFVRSIVGRAGAYTVVRVLLSVVGDRLLRCASASLVRCHRHDRVRVVSVCGSWIVTRRTKKRKQRRNDERTAIIGGRCALLFGAARRVALRIASACCFDNDANEMARNGLNETTTTNRYRQSSLRRCRVDSRLLQQTQQHCQNAKRIERGASVPSLDRRVLPTFKLLRIDLKRAQMLHRVVRAFVPRQQQIKHCDDTLVLCAQLRGTQENRKLNKFESQHEETSESRVPGRHRRRRAPRAAARCRRRSSPPRTWSSSFGVCVCVCVCVCVSVQPTIGNDDFTSSRRAARRRSARASTSNAKRKHQKRCVNKHGQTIVRSNVRR
jgi:hypothetical protein